MKNRLKKFAVMMLSVALLACGFRTALAETVDAEVRVMPEVTARSSTGVVEFDHSLTSTHENDTSLKISWSSTSGKTVYYSVAVKALDGYPQFTAATESGSIIGGYSGTYQKKESVTLKTSALPDPGVWIKIFVKGYAADKTTVTDEGAYVYFFIAEAPEDEYAELSRSTYSVDADGVDDVKVTVEANIDWSLDCSTEDWITLSKDSGSGNGKFYFSVAPNTRAVSRSATIWLMDNGRYITYDTLQITQEAAGEDPYLTVSPASIDDDGNGSTYTIAVSSNVNWKSSVGKTGKGWITIDKANGVGDASIKITVSANDTGKERTGKVLVDSADDEIINDIIITQKAVVEPENPTVSGFKVTPSAAEIGESFSIAGIVNGNGCKITAVSVGVRDADDGSIGGYWGQKSGLQASSYDLSNMGTLTAGTAIGNTTLTAGTYTVQVYATTAEGLSFEQEYTTTIMVTEPARNCWMFEAGSWYYLDGDGRMVTNAWVQDSQGWCYLGSDGRMVTNAWAQDSKGWCYLGSDGHAVTNCWMQDSVGWCYLDSEGSMTKDDWVQTDGQWYYLNSDGYLAGV